MKWPPPRVFSAGTVRGSSDAIGPIGIYTENAKGFAKARSYKVSSSVTNLFASVYAMPALNDISACRFDLDARVTPSLIEASATALTEGGTLMLTDAGLAATATTLTVCGGTNCSVEQANHTHVICRMPACTAATTATIMLHVSPDWPAAPHPRSTVHDAVLRNRSARHPDERHAVHPVACELTRRRQCQTPPQRGVVEVVDL